LHGVEEVTAEPCDDRGAEEHRHGCPRRALVGARAGPDLDDTLCGGRRIGELDARLPGRNEVRAGDRGLEQYLTVPVQHAYVDGCLESTPGSRKQQRGPDQVVGLRLVEPECLRRAISHDGAPFDDVSRPRPSKPGLLAVCPNQQPMATTCTPSR
jgi:hypothetical protein